MPIYLCLTDIFFQNFIYSYLADILKWIYLPNIGNYFNSLLLGFFYGGEFLHVMTTTTNPTQKNKTGIFCQKCLFTPKKSPKESGNLVFEEILPLSNLPPEVCYDYATSLSA
jgi:hypothetical protein